MEEFFEHPSTPPLHQEARGRGGGPGDVPDGAAPPGDVRAAAAPRGGLDPRPGAGGVSRARPQAVRPQTLTPPPPFARSWVSSPVVPHQWRQKKTPKKY